MLLLLAACQDYAIARSQVTDLFTQTGRDGPVDLLWVLDDSASMYEEREGLAASAGAFVTVLATSSVAFRLGVASTDPAAAGALRGPLLTPESPDLVDAFAAQVAPTEDGSRDEAGLEAAVLALSADGPNAELAGSTIDAEVIVYSDEDDHSEGDVPSLIASLAATRPSPVRVDAIVGDPPEGCFSLTAAADPGFRYIDARTLTGGLRESICSPDIDAMLTRVAHAALGLQTSFALSALPVLESMEVRVDGALLWRRDTDGWSYDAVANAVVFDGWAVPQPGATIIVDYYDWAGD